LLLAIGLERRLGSGDPESFRSAHYSVEAARQRLRWWSVPEAVLAEVERSGTVQRVFPLQTPWSGFVLEKNVVLGQRVMAGDPLYRLADLGVVWVEGEVFEQDLSLIRVGALVSASFQALPGTERQGRVTYIYPTIDLTTRTARIRVEFDNHQFVLKPGMYGTLQLETEIASGLSIPRSAIVATGTRNLVFLKRGGGRFEPREVTLGAGTGDRVHVLAGLAMGDTVVASATFLMDAESNLGSMLSGMGAMPGMDVAPSDTGAGSGTELPDHRMEDMTDMKGTDSARRSPARPAKRPPPASHQR
jgi:Cu(I)/Ag(I) efflux system membrane fusion protein